MYLFIIYFVLLLLFLFLFLLIKIIKYNINLFNVYYVIFLFFFLCHNINLVNNFRHKICALIYLYNACERKETKFMKILITS